ncbi:TPA: PhoPQ-activated pathogenicity-like protein PqaA type, partial [Candidatus Bathyarchaeota archaeon]|nr:PhoPQ-activated pathogenicity-like protein PqaA type [Candidatus Bathyarchaeota archaeon]
MDEAENVLKSFTEKVDSVFGWNIISETKISNVRVVKVILFSQIWRNSRWRHRLNILIPKTCKDEYTLLYVTGTSGEHEKLLLCINFTKSLSIPCAVLHDVPNQPLFQGLYEDALIAYTFKKYLETGDEEFPLLLPMVKSVRRSMDALEEMLRESLGQKPRGFIITGASKRGWTTWLTAAVDKRIVGIAPMVYDNLNLYRQMEHQIECYGTYSEQIADYTKLSLQQKMNTEMGKKLVELIDPYSYRDEIDIPKLIINGTNDRYWTVDSVNLYFNDLSGEKYILYVPNSGHSLEDKRRVINTLIEFTFSVMKKERLPEVKGVFDGESTFEVSVDQKASYVDLWIAKSQTMDFRSSKWTSFPGIKERDHFLFQISNK